VFFFFVLNINLFFSFFYWFFCFQFFVKKRKTNINNQRLTTKGRLEALAVNNGWATLVVLFLGDPHLLEGRQRGQN